MTFDIAPPLPLVPGDPLFLDPVLKQKLLEMTPESLNETAFQSHQLPWAFVLGILFFMLLLPFLLKELKGKKPLPPSFAKMGEISKKLLKLQTEEIDPKEKITKIARLLKRGFEAPLQQSNRHLTFDELLPLIEKKIPTASLKNWQADFRHLEALEYSQEPVSPEEAKEALSIALRILNSI